MQDLLVKTRATRSTDDRRLLWLLALVVPLLPILSVAAYLAFPSTIVAFATPIIVFVLLPILDTLGGVDNDNLSEAAMDAIADDPYYRRAVEAFIPLQYLSFFLVLAVIGWGQPPTLATLGFALSLGTVSGVAFNTAHEIGHKRGGRQRYLSQLAVAPSAYGHFHVEHNRGHHRRVATPEDPATSRLNEPYYRFWFRTVSMSAVSAWRLEAGRMKRNGWSVWNWRNQNLQGWAITVLLFTVAVAAFGPGIWWALLIQMVVGFSLFEIVNYIEHYGLVRSTLDNGRYEACQPHHSWNSNYRLTNAFLFQLQRHSDHHANPTRPYQILRNFDNAPNLPLGYASMVVLAACPPAWFRVMNPRVEAWRAQHGQPS